MYIFVYTNSKPHCIKLVVHAHYGLRQGCLETLALPINWLGFSLFLCKVDDLHEKYHECLEMLMENQVSNKHVNRILQQGFAHLCPLGIQGLSSCCVLVNY